MSLRDTILTATDIDEREVTVPEWGNITLLLKGMTGKQRIQLVEKASNTQKVYMYSDILIAVAYDPDTGDLVFDAADREALSEKAGGVLERLAQIAMELSGVNLDEAEKEVDEDPT